MFLFVFVDENLADRNVRISLYMLSVALATLGASYASVPLYKVFCQATGKQVITRFSIEYT